MRTKKFRAWDEPNETSHPNGCMTYFGVHDFIKGDYDVFEQYTGLKDRNGVEIYEGDLVEDTYPAGRSIYEVKIGEWDNGLTYDNQCGYGVFGVEHRWWPDYGNGVVNYNEIDGVIIGNIHQNPELLEQ